MQYPVRRRRPAALARPLGVALAIGFAMLPPAGAQTSTARLTLTVSGQGGIGAPGTSATCTSSCSASLPIGTAVTLIATPAAGQIFQGWSGACAGTASCAVTVRADTLVGARFAAANPPPTPPPPPPTGQTTRYLSPSGSDAADCLSLATACRSFAHVFARTAPGDELVLSDGVYSAAAGTGTMHPENGARSAPIPSGQPGKPVVVRALNPGRVTIEGPLKIGSKVRKDSHITVRGLRFEGGGTLYNTSFVTIKDSGFHGPFGIGTNDHHMGNTDNLVEDVWVWAAQQRIVAINYRAHRNVWRRVVVRGDGCGTDACRGSGNPNVGFTVYDSHDVSVQNMMVLDRVLAATDYPGADFATAQHTPDERYYFGRNEWLGILSLHAPDTGYYNFPDVGQTLDPTSKVVDAVMWNSHGPAFNLDREGTNNVLQNLTGSSRTSDVVRVGPALATRGGTLRNVVAVSGGSARYGINSAYRPSHADVIGPFTQGAYNQTSCGTVCLASDPRADGPVPSLKHLPRIEAGSALKGRGFSGADIGANVVYRIGTDGAGHGTPGYNTASTVPLWPWPNEGRIKADLCAATARGFCSTGRRLDGTGPVTLTSYVWEALGHPLPPEIYGQVR